MSHGSLKYQLDVILNFSINKGDVKGYQTRGCYAGIRKFLVSQKYILLYSKKLCICLFGINVCIDNFVKINMFMQKFMREKVRNNRINFLHMYQISSLDSSKFFKNIFKVIFYHEIWLINSVWLLLIFIFKMHRYSSK